MLFRSQIENQIREKQNQKPLTYEQTVKKINDDMENDFEFADFDNSVARLTEDAKARLKTAIERGPVVTPKPEPVIQEKPAEPVEPVVNAAEEARKQKEAEAAADAERQAKELAESEERTKARNELKAEILEHMKKHKIGIYSPMPSLATALETIDKLKKGNKTDVSAEGWMKGQGIVWTPNKKPQLTRMGKRFVNELNKLSDKLTDEQRASGSEDARILQAAADKANAITNKEREKAKAEKQKALEAQGVDKAKLEAAQADIQDEIGRAHV